MGDVGDLLPALPLLPPVEGVARLPFVEQRVHFLEQPFQIPVWYAEPQTPVGLCAPQIFQRAAHFEQIPFIYDQRTRTDREQQRQYSDDPSGQPHVRPSLCR